ncbi:MAG: hypothetical protein HEQ13_08020 [Dolichospermum sp. DEX189]|uniref:Uncharacterized protein n=1 Tax=Aphanizomenon flos-aquae FACHB-1040 TaxID=2692887 RepID=A0ABR8BUS0_APHFL|nr:MULTISPECIES: hypothetical protein [Nostocales]MBD2278507.1 hypothetical protein [Aphanizomenon flos-aquae FACHB-1040]MBO1069307.1 hypothetical protein [Dolichospermum sp. DEX189]
MKSEFLPAGFTTENCFLGMWESDRFGDVRCDSVRGASRRELALLQAVRFLGCGDDGMR